MKTEYLAYYIYDGVLSPSFACSELGDSVSGSLLVSRLIDPEGRLIDFLFLWGSSILSTSLPKDALGSVQF